MSSAAMTKEILQSEEASDMATMSTCERASAPHARPAIPELRIFVPTMVTMAAVGSTAIFSGFL